jgi:hypothetical protein
MDGITMGGGFHGSDGPPHASDSFRAALAEADQEYARAAAVAEAEREVRRALWEEDRVTLSVRMAQERGEVVSVREAYRNGGVAHSHADVIAYAGAAMDREDAQLEAEARRRARAIEKRLAAEVQAEREGHYADTSAPTPLQVEQGADMQARIDAREVQKKHDAELIERARRWAARDVGMRSW